MDFNDLFKNANLPTADVVTNYKQSFEQLTKEYTDLDAQISKMEARQEAIKEQLMADMQKYGLKNEESSTCTFSVSPGKTTHSCSLKTIEEKAPDILAMLQQRQLITEKVGKPSLSIKIKGPEKTKKTPAKNARAIKPAGNSTVPLNIPRPIAPPTAIPGLDTPVESL